ELAGLPAQLLGNTLIVRDLEAARMLAARGAAPFRFVTLQGELLETDGTLTVGTHHAATGILSRKSELTELQQTASELDATIAATERDLAGLRERLAALDSRIEQHSEEIQVLAEQSGDLRSRVQQHQDERHGLDEEVAVSRDELQRIEREISELDVA